MRCEPPRTLAPGAPAAPGFAGVWRKLRNWRRELVPATGVVVLALAAVLAAAVFVRHNQHIEQHRAALTKEFFHLYAQPPVSEARVRLGHVWQAHEPELAALLDRINGANGADELARRAMEWDYVVNRIIEEEGLEDEIDVVFRYFRAIGQCVGLGHCDGTMTAAYFGRDPWAFRNMHHAFLAEAYPDEDVDRYFERLAPRGRAG